MSDSLQPTNRGPPGSSVHGISENGVAQKHTKNTGMGCHFLLQGIFLQGSNLGFLYFRQILCHLSHQGSPSIRYGQYNFSERKPQEAKIKVKETDPIWSQFFPVTNSHSEMAPQVYFTDSHTHDKIFINSYYMT